MGFDSSKINKFNSFSIEQKVEVLYRYLVLGVAQPDIEELVWGKQNVRKAFNTSTIANGYNIYGKGYRGSFRSVTRDQIHNYVSMHPTYSDTNDIISYLRSVPNYQNHDESYNENNMKPIFYIIGGVIVLIVGYMLLMFLYNLLKPLIDFFMQYWLMIIMLVGIIAWVIRKDRS
ncbi:hypothetical protein ACTGYP_01370 [Streptococcus suis]